MESIYCLEVLTGLSTKELTRVLLNSPYDNLVDLERHSTQVYDLLSGPVFWLEKINNDFPDLEADEEEFENPRNLYIKAVINQYQDRIDNIENDAEEDPRIVENNEKISEIIEELDNLEKEKERLG